MKSIRTQMMLNPSRLGKSERLVIHTEKRLRELEKERAEEGHSVLQSLFLRIDYVGNQPIEDGNYLVIDLTANATMIVTFCSGRVMHNGSASLLQSFNNRDYYRWFKLPRLSTDDVTIVRDL